MKSFQELTHFQQYCLNRGISFVSYRLPGAIQVITAVSENGVTPVDSVSLKHFLNSEKGFVIMPFLKNKKGYWLNADHLFYGDDISYPAKEINNTDLSDTGNLLGSMQNDDKDALHRSVTDGRIHTKEFTNREEYIHKVQQVKQSIATGEVGKVVLSRKQQVELPIHEAPALFKQLTETYPAAFIYLIALPQSIWLGASPELLLSVKEKHGNTITIETMALAGTRKAGTKEPWGEKESVEQEWVTKFISEKIHHVIDVNRETTKSLNSNEELKKQNPDNRNILTRGPYTAGAGNVEHLRTDFRAEIPSEVLPELINSLHPTPAVCGWPADKALKVINQTEGYDRSFYTGFLGPVNMNDTTSIHVNLRCMEVTPESAAIYIGGGLTAASDPEKEWHETVIKSETLLAEIEKIRSKPTTIND